jgi:hypothetical protein
MAPGKGLNGLNAPTESRGRHNEAQSFDDDGALTPCRDNSLGGFRLPGSMGSGTDTRSCAAELLIVISVCSIS